MTQGPAPAGRALVIACGALSHELVALKRANGWDEMVVQCLPADLHNRPEKIASAVAEKITSGRAHYSTVFVAYADCGTRGALDEVLSREGVERLPGAHCYEFFTGASTFARLADAEPGTLYLTDFLARHFDRLIIRGLGIDRHPELEPEYFRHYTRLVYLAQDPAARAAPFAQAAARRLNLRYEFVPTGYGEMEVSLKALMRSA